MFDLSQHLYTTLSHAAQGLGRRAGTPTDIQSLLRFPVSSVCEVIIGVDALSVAPVVVL